MDSSEQTHPDQYTPQILLDHYYPPPDYDYSTTNPAIMTSEATGNGEAVTAANQSRISLNVHLAVPQGSGAEAAGGQDGSHTPNTPEILNSIVSMTSGPFHQYVPPPPVTAATLMETTELISPTYSTDGSIAQSDLSLESPVSSMSLNSPSSVVSTPGSAMSVQQYTSQFIKEGLKIKVKQKLGTPTSPMNPLTPMSTTTTSTNILTSPTKSEASSLPASTPEDDDEDEIKPPKIKRVRLEDLSAEDRVKRQRRRERNKVAATKCRNKKKARTANLVKEGEQLDTQNKSLKMEIARLEAEKSKLMEVLRQHRPNCAKQLEDIMKAKEEETLGAVVDMGEPEPEFRVPLPPDSSVTSASATASVTTSTLLPTVTITSPTEHEPPSFAEVEIKEEDADTMTLAAAPPTEIGGGYPAFEDYFGVNNDSASFYPSVSQSQVPFLGKRTLAHTYLDLDSRCIAL